MIEPKNSDVSRVIHNPLARHDWEIFIVSQLRHVDSQVESFIAITDTYGNNVARSDSIDCRRTWRKLIVGGIVDFNEEYGSNFQSLFCSILLLALGYDVADRIPIELVNQHVKRLDAAPFSTRLSHTLALRGRDAARSCRSYGQPEQAVPGRVAYLKPSHKTIRNLQLNSRTCCPTWTLLGFQRQIATKERTCCRYESIQTPRNGGGPSEMRQLFIEGKFQIR